MCYTINWPRSKQLALSTFKESSRTIPSWATNFKSTLKFPPCTRSVPTGGVKTRSVRRVSLWYATVIWNWKHTEYPLICTCLHGLFVLLCLSYFRVSDEYLFFIFSYPPIHSVLTKILIYIRKSDLYQTTNKIIKLAKCIYWDLQNIRCISTVGLRFEIWHVSHLCGHPRYISVAAFLYLESLLLLYVERCQVTFHGIRSCQLFSLVKDWTMPHRIHIYRSYHYRHDDHHRHRHHHHHHHQHHHHQHHHRRRCRHLRIVIEIVIVIITVIIIIIVTIIIFIHYRYHHFHYC